MRVELITIGNELTSGEVVDTNAAFMAELLSEAGLEVVFITTTGDEALRIEDSLRRAQERVEVIIVSGGLGPTKDDITASSAAKAMKLDLVLNREVLENLKKRFAEGGMEMPISNEKQAFFPRQAEIIPNPMGTACGFIVRRPGKVFIFLPGVPRELKVLMREKVIPFLEKERKEKVLVRSRTLKVFGFTESAIADLLKDVRPQDFSATLAYLPRYPENHVKIIIRGRVAEEAEDNLRKLESLIREKLQGRVIAVDRETLEEIVGQLLRAERANLAVAESCTGGLVARRLTQIAGSSDYFERSVVVYSNAAKVQMLGIPGDLIDRVGAVSAEVAEKMAEGVRRVSNATLGLAITGIAGPAGGSEEKPVGTVFIALASPKGTVSRRYPFMGDRDQIQTISAYTAIDWVRRYFLNLIPAFKNL
ncbi:MAG: competence/damage-inducible protein A [Deltaproteobacteria bacterium]|nr:competence/damage-inducible protein A [Deltaproteobacteria bacterium]